MAQESESVRNALITFDWADGTYTFRLPIAQLAELQEGCDAGPEWIFHRLNTGTWRINDIRETIRLGLIGGGMEPAAARRLTGRYVEKRPLLENLIPAQKILAVVLAGVPDEPPKKDGEAETRSEPQTSPEESSDLPISTALAQ